MHDNRLPRTGRTLGCALLILASLSLDCRKSTAEPSKATAVARPGSWVVAESIYDGSLKPGWQDWGWGKHDLSAGAARLDLSQYGGWILHHDPISKRFGALVFRVRAPSSAGRFLEVRLAAANNDQSFPALEIGPEHSRPIADGWTEIYVPWTALNPSSAAFDRITIRAKTAVGADWISFDKLLLTELDAKAIAAAAQAAPVRRVNLRASCSAKGHAISPYIYGMVADAKDSGDAGATTRRWGGNPTTRYNWQQGNTTNVGKDWFFKNTKTGDYQQFLRSCRAEKVTSALTIPTIGWVAKDTGSSGFPISAYGVQRAHDGDAGDGVRPDGSEIQPTSPNRTSVEASPEFIGRWVAAITKQDETTGTRSIQQYILDNEPNLWSVNHRDIHPEPVTYDELLDRTIRYGSAIRAADPKALIAGPAEWGWTGYFYSAKDAKVGVTMRPDRRAHGDVPLLPWYLAKLREHEKTTGTKILDILDVHFYPQGQGIYSDNSDPQTAALRLRSTRALWDPTYKDESWINDTVELIPRLKAWVAQNYPGLAISIGEYNFGGEKHISGGLALAEALGRFGALGVDYAYYWVGPPKDSPTYWAFRAFRNFDGKNGRFLDRSLDTQMAPEVSLFGSRDESGKHLVLIALNMNPTTSAKANIALPGCAAIATVRKFSYGPDSKSLVDEGLRTGGSLEETLLPYSINVFDITLK